MPGSFKNGEASSLAKIAQHYIESLREDAKNRESSPPPSTDYQPREVVPLRIGDLWLTRGTSEDPPTLLALSWIGEGINRAVVVLDEPELAAADDLLVSAEQCPLGVPVALCAWRDVPVADTDLWQLVGSLPDEIVEPLAMFLQRRLTGAFRCRVLGSGRLPTGEGGVRWLIESSKDPRFAAEYLSGAPILTPMDPRIQVREELVRFTTYLENRALQDLVVEQLGSGEEVRSLSRWLEGLIRPDFFPATFGSPRLAFLSVGRHARAFARSGNEELVVTVRPGQQVVLNLAPDGRGEVINEIRDFERVGLVLANRGNNKVVPIGFRGQPSQPALVVSRERRELIWYDTASAAGELFVGVFLAE